MKHKITKRTIFPIKNFRASHAKATGISIIIGFILGCTTKSQPAANPASLKKDQHIDDLSDQEEVINHKDSSYHYEYRTGTSGNYEYNYDVIGYDVDNNELSGSIAIHGKQGTGVLKDAKKNEFDVDVEWIDYGKLKAKDKSGNEYILKVI